MPPKKRQVTTPERGAMTPARRRTESKARDEAEAAEIRARMARWKADGTLPPTQPIYARLPSTSAEARKRREEAMQADVEEYKKRLLARQAEQHKNELGPVLSDDSDPARASGSTSSSTRAIADLKKIPDTATFVWKQAKVGTDTLCTLKALSGHRAPPSARKQVDESEGAAQQEIQERFSPPCDETQEVDNTSAVSPNDSPKLDTTDDAVHEGQRCLDIDRPQSNKKFMGRNRSIIFRDTEDGGQRGQLDQGSTMGTTGGWNLRQRLQQTLDDQE